MTKRTNPQPLTRGVTDPLRPTTGSIAAGLDWLQYSIEWPTGLTSWPSEPDAMREILIRCLPPGGEIRLTGELLTPITGYSAGMGAYYARLFWHATRREQHIGVVMTGDDLRGMVGITYPQRDLLKFVTGKARKIARLDLAIDTFEPEANPTDILTAWRAGDVATPARQVADLTSHTRDSDGVVRSAPTVYVGSRGSDRQLRVYDKASQQGIPWHWVRIELQLRDDRAMGIAKACVSNGIRETAQAAVRDYCEVSGCLWWHNAVAGPTVDFDALGRRESNTDKWLKNQIMPILEKRLHEQAENNDTSLRDALLRTIENSGRFSGQTIEEMYNIWIDSKD